MTRQPKEERDRRRNADDGNRDDAVYLVSSRSTTYHEDPECQYLRSAERRIATMTRGDALDRTRRVPCAECVIPEEHGRNVGAERTHPTERYADLIAAESER